MNRIKLYKYLGLVLFLSGAYALGGCTNQNTMDTSTAHKTGYTLTGIKTLYDHAGNPQPGFKAYVGKFNEQQQPISEEEYSEKGNLARQKVYDEKQRLAEEIVYTPGGAVDHKLRLKYDAQGRLSEKEMWLGSGAYHGKWLLHYNEAGKLQKEVWLNKNGQEEAKDEYSYTEGGKTVHKKREGLAQWTYQYDSQGRLIHSKGGYFSDDEHTTLEYTYAENGFLASEISYYSPGKVKSKVVYTLEK